MEHLVDPFSLRQPTAGVVEFDAADEINQPGVTWHFRLVDKHAVGYHLAETMARLLKQRYLFGSPDGLVPAVPFPAVGGQPVVVSEQLFELVAQFWALQEGVQSVPAYDDMNARIPGIMSAEQIVAMAAVAPMAWSVCMIKSAQMVNQGNELASSEQTSSAQA